MWKLNLQDLHLAINISLRWLWHSSFSFLSVWYFAFWFSTFQVCDLAAVRSTSM